MILGVETYTVRKQAKINLAQTLEELKKIGVHSVELCKIKVNQKNLSIIKNSGMNIISMLLTMKTLTNQFNQVVSFCKKTGCKIVVVSVMPLYAIFGREKALLKLSLHLNYLSIKFQAEGIQLAYHHHDYEFKVIGNETKLGFILRKTTPDLKIVSDTLWAKKSNQEPEELIKSLGSRLIGLHLRDCSQDQYKDCDLGSGIINFKKVLIEASKYAVFAVLEQKSNTPMVSLNNSIHYMSTIQSKHQFK